MHQSSLFGFNVIAFDKKPTEMNVQIGRHSYNTGLIEVINDGELIEIGSYVSIGKKFKIITTFGHHFYNSLSIFSFSRAKYNSKGGVTIGNDVWIGDDVTIMGGVRIGDGAIIGTKSLVTKSLDPYGIYGGVPAHLLGYRFTPDIIKDLLDLRWWQYDDDRIIKIVSELENDAVTKISSLRSVISEIQGKKSVN